MAHSGTISDLIFHLFNSFEKYSLRPNALCLMTTQGQSTSLHRQGLLMLFSSPDLRLIADDRTIG